jgi:hypothetical protein
VLAHYDHSKRILGARTVAAPMGRLRGEVRWTSGAS